MGKTLSTKELELLAMLAEFQVLSVNQLSVLLSSSQQMTRRRISDLSKSSLVGVTNQPLRGSVGRPESVVFVQTSGVEILKEQGVIKSDSVGNQLTKVDFRSLGHRLMINWFRIHLSFLSRQAPALTVNFLSPTAQSEWYQKGLSDSQSPEHIPDGIFSINEANQGRSLLFFLEVDMATETLSSSNPLSKDIRKKILAYQKVFVSNHYVQLEAHLAGKFRGFRVLFVAPTRARLDQLCRLVAGITGTGFVWLTDSDSLFQHGVSGLIWVRGGELEAGRFSILGSSLSFDCPVMPSQ